MSELLVRPILSGIHLPMYGKQREPTNPILRVMVGLGTVKNPGKGKNTASYIAGGVPIEVEYF